MKIRLLIGIGIVISVNLIFFLSNYHIEYDDQAHVYIFCEEFLFSGFKQCTVIGRW